VDVAVGVGSGAMPARQRDNAATGVFFWKPIEENSQFLEF
jgi:hypothetical protein